MTATKLSPQNAPAPALGVLEDVAVVRGQRLLFQNVNLAVLPGTVVQLAGANGAGKTSLLRAIAGALPPAQGRIITRDHLRVAFLPADDALWQGVMTVRAALRDWVRATGGDVAAVDGALGAGALAALADRSMAQLSMGQKRRLSWARVLLAGATLWLLDEPFNSLDDAGLDIVRQLMAQHVAAGGAIVAACHEQLPAQLGGVDVGVVQLSQGAV